MQVQSISLKTQECSLSGSTEPTQIRGEVCPFANLAGRHGLHPPSCGIADNLLLSLVTLETALTGPNDCGVIGCPSRGIMAAMPSRTFPSRGSEIREERASTPTCKAITVEHGCRGLVIVGCVRGIRRVTDESSGPR